MDQENSSEPQMPNLAKKSEPVLYATEEVRTNTPNIEQNFTLGSDEPKKSGKKFIFIILIIVVLAGIGFFLYKSRSSIKGLVSGPTPTPTPIATPAPTEAPKVLERSEWSFEVLNGSGSTGLAKKIADRIKDLGYQVVKTGNADKSNYPITQILVKKDLAEKLDLVIADLTDTIKIASYAGELNDSTASARIILGKDSI